MSNYPWFVEDKINAAIRGLAASHEVYEVRRDVGSVEHSLREACAEITSLRAELLELRHQVSTIQDWIDYQQQEKT